MSGQLAANRHRDAVIVSQRSSSNWNGNQWRAIANTPDGILYGVSAVSSADVWAVGDVYGKPLMMHWDGKSWPSAASSATGTRLSSVAARATYDVWAVGYRYDQYAAQVAILHWDGRDWTTAHATGPGLSGNMLNGAVAVSASESRAGGSYWHYYEAQQALIMRSIA